MADSYQTIDPTDMSIGVIVNIEKLSSPVPYIESLRYTANISSRNRQQVDGGGGGEEGGGEGGKKKNVEKKKKKK